MEESIERGTSLSSYAKERSITWLSPTNSTNWGVFFKSRSANNCICREKHYKCFNNQKINTYAILSIKCVNVKSLNSISRIIYMIPKAQNNQKLKNWEHMRKGYHIMSFSSSTSCNHNPKIILQQCLLCCGFNLFFLIRSSFSATYLYRWLGSLCCKREFLGCNNTWIDLFFHLLILC